MWESDTHRGATIRQAFDGHVPSVEDCDPPHDGEPQARARLLVAVAVELDEGAQTLDSFLAKIKGFIDTRAARP